MTTRVHALVLTTYGSSWRFSEETGVVFSDIRGILDVIPELGHVAPARPYRAIAPRLLLG